ncbi:hypothetical protein [Streptomyces glaucosporus]|uniref:hypothetical protein n=1 Tax=Streptomyces glaucosporus TaxID=284044 RepID=UPI0031D76819
MEDTGGEGAAGRHRGSGVTVRLLYDTMSGLDGLARGHHDRLAGLAAWPEIGPEGNLLHSSSGGGPSQPLEQIWVGRDDGAEGRLVVEATADRGRACVADSLGEAVAVYRRWVREYVARLDVLFEYSDVPGCGRDQYYGTGGPAAG